MDALQAKKALIDIVKHAYPRSPRLKEYCDFNFMIVDKQLRSKHGDYTGSLKRIRIFNTESRTLTHLITTSIHELAHHIDHCNRGKSDHSTAFYEEYKHLVFAALDLNMFGINELFESKRDAADSTKLKLMIIEYMEQGRAKRERIERASKIVVYHSFDIKDQLKAMGYKWDSVSRAWCRELGEDAEGDVRRIEELIEKSGSNAYYRLEEPPSFDAPPEMPNSYCFHTFTKEEREQLLSGKEIYVEKCWSRKRALFFSCHLSWSGEEFNVQIGDV